MSKPQPRLGKGLDAILGQRRGRPPASPADSPASSPTANSPAAVPPGPTAAPRAVDGGADLASGVKVRSLPIDQVVPNARQPRTRFDAGRLSELADSIRNSGLVQPVVVRPGADGRFELIAGERRWRAARQAGMQSVPAVVRDASDAEALELALVENLQREDLNPIERATAYERYIEAFGATAEQLAIRLGESRANVANYLRLLRFTGEIRDMIERGALGMGQARAIAGVTDPQRQLALARLAVRRNLSTRQVEALTKTATASPAGQPAAAERVRDANADHVQRSLSKALGLPVVLQPGKRKNSGRIVIRYSSLEEFDRIAERLCGDTTLE